MITLSDLHCHCLLLPKLVFDANGKLPAGILSSISDGCDLQRLTSDTLCGDQPYDFLKKLIKIPHGNTVSIGAIDECLRATNEESGASFTSRHVFLALQSSDDKEKSRDFSFKGKKSSTKAPSVDALASVLQGSLTVTLNGKILTQIKKTGGHLIEFHLIKSVDRKFLII